MARMVSAACPGANMAQREKATMTAEEMTKTRQLTLGPGSSMSSAGALLSS
ncbi:hypothetical protein ACR6C2_40620 [Streptomyces sp. INA 01156]